MSHSSFFDANLATLEQRFPHVARLIGTARDRTNECRTDECRTKDTEEGPVVLARGQSLDHPSHPKQAAQQWAARVCSTLSSWESPILVFGFGGGYHLEALHQQGIGSIGVYEPSISAFVVALESRDLRPIIESLSFLWVKDIPTEISADTQLVTRALSQAVFPAEWEEVRKVVYAARGTEKLKPSMAVFGPLQGGTLPILAYVHQAFLRMGFRCRAIDASPMAAGYHQVGSVLSNQIRRQLAEGAYIEFISNLAVESVHDRPVDIFICLAQAPITIKALQQLRSLGVITVLWFVEDYHRFSYWQPFAPHFDFIFTIQKEPCISAMKRAGATEVHYLPVACDPHIHAPFTLSPEERTRWGSPVSFVGAGYHNRQQTFAALSYLPFKIWGTEWPDGKPFNRLVQEGGRRLSPLEYTKIFNATQININLHSSSERDGVDPFGDFVNPRTFELAATGAFQLVDYRSLLPELFIPGEELVTFRTLPELKELIQHYLEHPEAMAQTVMRARSRALAEHTYEHRMRQLLSMIYRVKYDHLATRQQNHPWTKVLERAREFPELRTRFEKAYTRGDEPVLDSLISDIGTGKGKLGTLDQELLFLHHVKKNMVLKKPGEV